MNKQPDFGNDLATLTEHVTAEVGDVLEALQQKRSGSRPTIVRKVDESAKQLTEPIVDGSGSPDHSEATTPQRRRRESNRPRPAPAVERENVWKSVTTRLRLETKEVLEEACLRQELKKKSPHTAQGITDEALNDWFRKHGYGRNRSEDAGE